MIESKLTRPKLRAGMIDRPRISALLDRPAEVTLVSAPAGYGKTIAVAQWLRDTPAGWVSLDAADNDPVRLWSYAAAALGVRQRSGPLEAAIEALAAHGRRLVLDDVHVLTDAECLATLEYAARVFGGLVLITRADPPIRLARRRTEGALSELRADALAFTGDEAARVLGAGADPRVITARTEGWPAAVYLVALWLREGGDPRKLPAHHLSEYLATEVLAGLDGEARDFLVRTSVLPRLSAELCDHVLEIDDSAARLEASLRANLFLVALDDGWFRYHDLFRTLVRRELPAKTAAQLHRRAADWCLERDEFEEAAEHAHAAGDHAMVLEILNEHHLWLFRRGRGVTVLRWISGIPEHELASRSRVLLAAAAAAANRSRPRSEVQRLLAAAQRAGEADPATWTGYEQTALKMLIAGVSDDDVPAGVEAALAAVAAAQAHAEEFLVYSLATLAIARLLAGDEADAIRAAEQALAQPAAARRPHGFASASATLAMIRAEQGRLTTARELADQALAVVGDTGNSGSRSDARARAADAFVARREGRLAHAAEAGEQALALLVPSAFTAWMRVELALVRSQRGERGRARDELERARAALAECRDAGIVGALADQAEATLAAPPNPVTEPISAAERLVLAQLATPRSYAQIAGELFLSTNTVKTHVKAIYRKLGAHSRDEALTRARALGLLDDHPGDPSAN